MFSMRNICFSEEPMNPTARLTWRRITIKILGDIHGVENLEEAEQLLNNLLQQPKLLQLQETIVHVPPPIEDRLSDFARRRNVQELLDLGGIAQVLSALKTDAQNGIIPADDGDLSFRRQNFGSNRIIPSREPSPRIILQQVLLASFKDPIVVILLLWGILALSFGIKNQGKHGLSDGLCICLAVFTISAITTFSNFWPKFQLFQLSKARENFSISVLRNGHEKSISVFEAVVGDVVILKTGDQVPADGLCLEGNSLQVDESNVRDREVSVAVDNIRNPFLLSGTKVINGDGRMLVTAFGKNTETDQSTITPLQKSLHELSKLISNIGLAVAFIVLVVLMTRYFTGNLKDGDGKPHFVSGKTRLWKVFDDVIGILATPGSIASTSIPEGLLLAILISIALSTKRMMFQNVLVTNLAAFEAIGNTSVICTDERGILTLIDPSEVKIFFFGGGPSSSAIPRNVRELVFQAVHSNTRVLDNQIEKAIQEWSTSQLGLDLVIRPNDHDNVYQKGEAEDILSECSHYYDQTGNIKEIPDSFQGDLRRIIQEMKDSKGLRCIAFAHKKNPSEDGNSEAEHLIFMGFVGIPDVRKAVEDYQKSGFDIKIVSRNDLSAATAAAIACGILDLNRDITMNTGEVVEGQEFRSYEKNEKLEKCNRIRVMARASTPDKRCMVHCLKMKGHKVAVTEDSAGDAIVLREADLGVSFRTHGTQQAIASSDVIIKDDNMVSFPRLITWGRAMLQRIQLYAQFILTVSFSSLVIDFVTAVSASEPPTFKIVTAISSGKIPYATLQVLWVKLIVGTLAALAITAEKAPEEHRQLPRVLERGHPFITRTMWKNIALQAFYPILILLMIHFQGELAFGLNLRAKDTLIFNIFVLWQLCVILNTKRIERKLSEGMWRRKLLWGIIVVIILLQVVMVELLHEFADTKPLTWKQWMICVGIAFGAWPFRWLVEKIECSADAFFQHCDHE